ncbi:hypothetical protein GCM10028818_10930 [Spirosoma horti]
MNNPLTSAFAKTFVAFFLLSSTSLLANPTAPTKPATFDASVYVNKANRIRLAVEKTTAESLTITLRQAGENVPVFMRQIGKKQTKAAIQLNVDELADGTYELEITSASGRIVKQVNLQAATPVMTSERLLAIQ